MSPFDPDRVASALAYAVAMHGDQVRKGTSVPYVSHLLSVSALVVADGGDEDQAVAALLHDVVEDTDATVEEVGRAFGERVAEIVDGCSDSDGEPKPPWSARKTAYLDHLRTDSIDVGALRVSAADKLDNVRSMLEEHERVGDQLWGRFNAPPDRQLWYYTSVSEVVGRRLATPLTARLAAAVADLAGIVPDR